MQKPYVYAPGCALMSYKPHLAEKLKTWAESKFGPMDTLLTCCFRSPELEAGTCIVTPCATCTGQYLKNNPDATSLFLLTTIAESNDFPFPDYKGMKMSIQDTCAARSKPEYLATIRTLLQRMNIELVEPEKSGKRARCCGQVFYGKVPTEKVEEQMRKRADEMPCGEVVTYCASCIMAMTVGGKHPRYILVLLFGEGTDMAQEGVESWNGKLKIFRETH